MQHLIALFGEAEKGSYNKPYFLHSLLELVDTLGLPPGESKGLDFAVQALMFEKGIIYFRVEEEGFSNTDYIMGYKKLSQKEKIGFVDAICLPGVGKEEIIRGAQDLCYQYKSVIVLTEKDFYDYLTTCA
jgi:hypothetical protein